MGREREQWYEMGERYKNNAHALSFNVFINELKRVSAPLAKPSLLV